MKKITKKLKGKKVLSLVLAAIMLATTFNIALPMLKLDASAAGTITTSDGTNETVTQEHVVTDYEAKYLEYANNYLNGAGKATEIVVPGLKVGSDGAQNDYVIQGMSYYPEKDWILVTAYHNDETYSSKVFCLDAKSGEFYAMLSFLDVPNESGTRTVNKDHGGGIAVSEHNLYYSCGDKDRSIAYAPLSALDDIQKGEHRVVELVDEIIFYEVGSVSDGDKTAYTAYVCYDDGILWMGNFYDPGIILGLMAADYKVKANQDWDSMVWGYTLAGNSSEEEWASLKGQYKNLFTLSNHSGTETKYEKDANGNNITSKPISTIKWNAFQDDGVYKIEGSISAPTTYVGEFCPSFGSFTLEANQQYRISYISTNSLTDMYMFGPTGHCNVNGAAIAAGTKYQLADGRWYYEMTFTPGIKPTGADSGWTDGTAASAGGDYTIRFDQDAIQAGEARDFEISDIKLEKVISNVPVSTTSEVFSAGCAGSPSYAIALADQETLDIKQVQYAVVDNGRLYLSRSYGSGTGNSTTFGYDDTSHLTVADIDLSVPGKETVTISTGPETTDTKTIDGVYKIDEYDDFPMMAMSEGLCVIDGNIYITFEGASNKYMNESDGALSIGNTDEPVDVVWKVDPYALMDEFRVDSEEGKYFEKVTSLEAINDEDEYIIVYESPERNPVTQKNILYAFNAHGNFKDFKLSKTTLFNRVGYDGMIGYPISEYSIENDKLYFTNPERDDIANIRWHLSGVSDETGITSSNVNIQSELPYYMRNRNFYFESGLICMASDDIIDTDTFNEIIIEEAGDTGNFYLKSGDSYLWCNDFSVDGYETAANNWYKNEESIKMYKGLTETKGTFHTNGLSDDNVIKQNIAPNYYLRQFSIYKCVADTFSSTAKNRVYTDMSAELQSDGTYTVTLETYATSGLHYKATEAEKPTDYIFVIDDSVSMGKGDGTGMIEYVHTQGVFGSGCGDLQVYSVAGESKKTSFIDGTYNITQAEGAFGSTDIYVNIDGTFVKLAVETSPTLENGDDQYVWLSGTYRGLVYYWHPTDPTNAEKYGTWELTKPTEAETIMVSGNDSRARGNTTIYYGTHYRYTTTDYAPRLTTAKETACSIIDQIKADGLDHRFAVTQYGEKTGFYTAGSSTITDTTDYSDVFWSMSQTDELKNTINSISVTIPTSNGTVTSNDGTDCANVFKHANGIINTESYKELYKRADKDGRNVAVIFISDGFAGSDSVKFTKGGLFSSDKTEYSQTGTLTDANNVIKQAKTLKEDGAFIYTFLVGQSSPTAYEQNLYMQAISSQYPEATSLDDAGLGGECVENTLYFYSLSDANAEFFLKHADYLYSNVKLNDDVTIEKLEEDAVIIEQLSDAFIIPDGYDKATFNLYKGYYDYLDRFQFNETAETNSTVLSGIETTTTTINPDTPNDAIMVTGFNYSERYIARNHDGYKLKVTLSGLLANPKANITNTSLNNINTTAVYQSYDEGNLSGNTPFKYFPTEYFTIPEYTYVMDYGQKMLDTEINGTLCSVSDIPDKQDSYSSTSDNGVLEITNQNLDLYYTMKPDAYANGVDETDGSTDYSAYALIKRDITNKYDWFKIKLVPASNVLYEESALTIANKDSAEKIADVPAYQWGKVGKVDTITTQDLSTNKDVYGYDNHYANSTDFSNGTHYYTTVDSSTKKSDVATFEFTGTGFDLISACGPNTGVQMVVVKQNGTTKKAFIVDTYYDDAEGRTALLDSNGLMYQVPIVNFSSTYGTYTVEARAYYISGAGAVVNKSTTKSNIIDTGLVMNSSKLSSNAEIEKILAKEGIDAEDVELVWFDDNSVLNGGTGVAPTKKGSRADFGANVTLHNYIDGIRIYNPLGTDTSAYDDYIETEKNVTYANVIDNLAPVSESDGSAITDINGIAFITGILPDLTDEEGDPILDENGNPVKEALTFANYESYGPTGELYLNGGQAISFKINRAENERVMLGLRAVNGAATAQVNNIEIKTGINSATEMYYDISNCIGDGDGITITVSNTGSTLLAINHIKFSGDSDKNTTVISGARSLNRSSDASQVSESIFLPVTEADLVEIEEVMSADTIPAIVKNGVVIPLVEEEEEIPEDNTNTDDDNTNDGADTEGSENEEFSIFSIIEMLIAFIEKILRNAFNVASIA